MEGSGTPLTHGSGTISADEFQALESKVLQAVEMIRHEREERAGVEADRKAAHAENSALLERLSSLEEANSTIQTELEGAQREREIIRGRVERMLAQINELL